MYFDGVNPLIFLTNGWLHNNTNKLLLYGTAISVLSGGSDLVYIEGPITVLIDRMTLWPHACPHAVLIAVGERFTKMIGCSIFWFQKKELSCMCFFRKFSVQYIFANIVWAWGKLPQVKYLQMDTMKLWWMYFICRNIMRPWDPSTWVMMRPLWFFCVKDAGRRPNKITGIQTVWRHNADTCSDNRSSLATAPSAAPLPCRVPLNGMFHQDSATQWNKLRIWKICYHE